MRKLNIQAVILAAGQSTRLASAGIAEKKQFINLNGRPLFWKCAETFASIPRIKGLVFVFPPEELEMRTRELESLMLENPTGLPWLAAPGGERRQDSVYSALSVLPEDCDAVLIHDSARPFVSAHVVQRVISALENGAQAVIPGIPLKDTIKVVEEGRVISTPARDSLTAVQTPQGIVREVLAKAFDFAISGNTTVTDDASLAELIGVETVVVPGDEQNVKITSLSDMRLLEEKRTCADGVVVSGFGYDVHRFGAGRPLVLGGMPIPGSLEIIAHSDGDVLLHALIDAVMGCAGLGDIGEMFPDSDPRYAGISSSILLNEALIAADEAGFEPVHADLTLIAQVPRLSPWKEEIRRNVARLLKLDYSRVNVKATTEEGLGFTGEKKGIKATALVTGILRGK